MSKLTELQEQIGYTFRQEGLLRQALTHSSYANEKHMKKYSDNEKLEFLGDAVLEVTSSEFLYHHYPKLSETRSVSGITCTSEKARSRPGEGSASRFSRTRLRR